MKVLATLSLSLLLTSTTFAAGLKVYTEDAPPLNFVKDGKPEGVAVAIVKEIQAKIGDKTAIEVVPWARSYKALEEEENIALFSTTRTEQRELLFKWVGPLATKNWVFVKKKGAAVSIANIDDARKVKSIGTYQQDAKEQYLKELKFTNLDSAPSDDLNCKKLDAGRIDVWLTGETDMIDLCKKVGVDSNNFEIVFLAQKKELYIAFSKKTADDVVKKWQEGYDALVKEGKYKALHEKYGN